ncbi:MAG: hypothetical protein ACREMY_05385 [bacterium]
MKTLKTLLAAAVVLATLAAPGSAKSVWDQINESAPLQPVFADLQTNAP